MPVDTKLQQKYREELGIPTRGKVIFVTGGGNGADQLNQIVAESAPTLLGRYADLTIIHVAGRAHETKLNELYDALLPKEARKHVVVKGFITDMYRYSGAADLVVARGGATGLAEFAVQRKACLIIPSKQLVWQVHHARTLADRQAILNLSEREAKQPGRFTEAVEGLLGDETARRILADNLAELARPDAGRSLAMLLLDKMKRSSR